MCRWNSNSIENTHYILIFGLVYVCYLCFLLDISKTISGKNMKFCVYLRLRLVHMDI